MGLYSLIIMGMSVFACIEQTDIPSGVITAYIWVVGFYSGSKTILKYLPKAEQKNTEDDVEAEQ